MTDGRMKLPPLVGPQHEVIRASAGTGKTFRLSNRYLSLLRRQVSADTILATTFTRKAAGEILERVLLRLAEAADDDTAATELGQFLQDEDFSRKHAAEMLAGLTGHLHRTSISTIDSFFHSMALCFRHELNIAPGVQVVDENSPLATQLRRQAIDAMLGDSDTQLLVDLLRRIHHDKAKRSITEAIDDIVSNLYQLYLQTGKEQALWETLPIPDRVLTPSLLAEHINLLQTMLEAAKENEKLAKALQNNYESAIAGDWRGFLGTGIAKVVSEGKDSFNRKDLDSDMVRLFENLVRHAHAVEIGYVAHQTRATYALLERFDEHYTRLRAAHNLMLFSDIPLQLADTLKNQAQLFDDLYYRLDTRVSHLLLDEFQDTSPMQWDILRPFAEEITSQHDPEHAERTFFCVGDVKQAIYGWRGGSAAIFSQLENDLPLADDSFETLNRSYRSSQEILDAANKVFGNLSQVHSLGKFSAILENWNREYHRHDTANDLPGYFELATTEPGNGDLKANEAHVQAAAARIEQIAATAQGRSIGVLVRKREMIRKLVYLLKARKLSVSGEGANPLTDDPAVSVILSALTLADHPQHTAAAFHVLNSPLGEVIGLQSTEKQHCLAVTKTIRERLVIDGYAKTLANWIRQIAARCNEQTLYKLDQLVEMADQYQPLVSLRPSHFVEFINRSDVEQPSAAQIRVMTIHKSKGLEFDVVILPELNASVSRVTNAATCVTRDEPTGPITAIYRGTNAQTRAISEQLQEAYRQEQVRIVDDNLCALYVAMTRARHALHVLVKPLQATKNGSVSHSDYPADSFAAIIRETLDIQDENFNVAQTLYQNGDPKWYEDHDAKAKLPLADAAEIIEPPHVVSDRPTRFITHATPSSMEDAGRIHVSNILRLDENTAALRGTVIHELFSTLDWLDRPVAAVDQAAWIELARRAAPQMNDSWCRQVVAQFAEMIMQPNVQQMLSLSRYSADEKNLALLREHRFAVRLGDQLINGSFDRVVLELQSGHPAQGHLIDFKSDSVMADRSNLEELGERYRPQIKAYRQALEQIYGLKQDNIISHLLFTGADEVVEIS